MKKTWIFFWIFSLILASFPSASADSVLYGTVDPTIKVGLFYGTDALPSANLINEVGQGYFFGYFDTQRVFVPLGSTTEEKITTLKDKTLYTLKGTYYDALPPAGATVIGAFHIDSGVVYATFDEAKLAADQLTATTALQAFPCHILGAFRVRIGAYETVEQAAAALPALGLSGAMAVGGSETCYTTVVTSSGKILFEFDAGSKTGLTIQPTGAPYPVTWFKYFKYAGAFEFRRNAGNDLSVFNVLPLSEYIKGVLPYEMSPRWPIEALKAQGVSAATFALRNRNRHASAGFDICNTTHCQVYKGRNSATEQSDAAAEAIKGLGLYYNNQPCNTVYHSSNGGSTESSQNVWNESIPYLIAVPDNFEDLKNANNGLWTYTYSAAEITWILQQKGYAIRQIVDAYVDEYTPAGNVYRVVFVDTQGTRLSFEKSAARTILNSETLKKYTHSQRYTISNGIGFFSYGSTSKMSAADGYALGADGQITRLTGRTDLHLLSASGSSVLKRSVDTFYVSGRGWGHSVGMSQYGAKGMAELGYTFDKILQYYYTGAVLQPLQ